ncbi:glycoprotein A33 (transmembrane), paralog a [Neolamprologus brichardi]|uniref:glycoprotein A33 (transmembrane), paralog a n=1 Tax=Neolamprologus brichardi TaxID=32507 RepID=UPI001643E558|nr:glycoprotein A33 (transmembrane), paralog a [Neolamprologus brichardi]
MEKRILYWTILCMVLTGVRAIDVTMPQTQYESARGDNITLPCSFKSAININTAEAVVITWTAMALEANVKDATILTYYYPLKKTGITPAYKGRVSLDVDVLNGKADLKLSSISLVDNKDFKCHVLIPDDEEGNQDASARLVVLVAPSTPVCKIQGTAQYGQDITLSCLSAEGSPPPTYSWERHNVQNQPVPQPPKTTDKDGILSLYNISKDTSGYYICTSRNKIRFATCNLTLAVMPPSMNIASSPAIIGAAVGGLILLILIIIICCCCCRKKNKDEEYEMGNGEGRRVEVQGKDSYEDSSVKRTEDRRSDYHDRRRDYDDRRSDYDDRRERYDDDRRYQDRRRDDNRYDDRDRDRPPVPNNKPTRRDYHD